MSFIPNIQKDLETKIEANGANSMVLMNFGVGNCWDVVFRGTYYECCVWQNTQRRNVAAQKAAAEAQIEQTRIDAKALADYVESRTAYCIETVCSKCGAPLGVYVTSKSDWDTKKGEVGNALFEHNESEVVLPTNKNRKVKLQFRSCWGCRES